MVYKTAEEQGREPRWPEIERAIRRNFGGLDEIDPVKIFRKHAPFSRNEMVGVLNNLFVYSCLCYASTIFHRWSTQVLRKLFKLAWVGILCAS